MNQIWSLATSQLPAEGEQVAVIRRDTQQVVERGLDSERVHQSATSTGERRGNRWHRLRHRCAQAKPGEQRWCSIGDHDGEHPRRGESLEPGEKTRQAGDAHQGEGHVSSDRAFAGAIRNDVEAQQALVRQTITRASRQVGIAAEVQQAVRRSSPRWSSSGFCFACRCSGGQGRWRCWSLNSQS
jgi:hypothetical protein